MPFNLYASSDLEKMKPCVNFELFSSKVADSKREEFRKYLEKAGVMDALTKGNYLSFRQSNEAPVAKLYFFLCVYSSREFVRGTGETS